MPSPQYRSCIAAVGVVVVVMAALMHMVEVWVAMTDVYSRYGG